MTTQALLAPRVHQVQLGLDIMSTMLAIVVHVKLAKPMRTQTARHRAQTVRSVHMRRTVLSSAFFAVLVVNSMTIAIHRRHAWTPRCAHRHVLQGFRIMTVTKRLSVSLVCQESIQRVALELLLYVLDVSPVLPMQTWMHQHPVPPARPGMQQEKVTRASAARVQLASLHL